MRSNSGGSKRRFGRAAVPRGSVLRNGIGGTSGNGETGVVRVEDNAADGEEDVDDAGDEQRDDEGVLEARRVLHAGLAVRKKRRRITRDDKLTKATPMEKQITPNMLAISR